MLQLVQRTLVGQATDNQQSGAMVHPTQPIVILFSVSSPSGETFLDYCRDQFEHEDPNTTLELHQLLERCIATAQRMEVDLSLVSVGLVAESVVLAAYRGSIWLKRGSKNGQILSAEDSLQILEGKTQAGDIYILFSQAASSLQKIIQPYMEKASSKTALGLIELPELRSAITGANQEAEISLSVVGVEEEMTVGEESAEKKEDHLSLTPSQAEPVVLTPAQIESAYVEKPKNLLTSVVETLSSVSGGVSKLWGNLQIELDQLFSQDVYVRRKKRRTLGQILIVVVVIFFAALGMFAFVRNHQREQQKQLAAVLQPFRARFIEVQNQTRQNPVIGRQQTEQLITDIDAQARDPGTPKFLSEALNNELNGVREYYESISGQEELPVLPTYFDLRLVQSNFLASRVDVTPETLFFLDSGQRKILALNIEKKQPTMLPIGEYPDIRAVIADEKYLYFLAQGLFRFTLSGTDVASLVENADDTINNSQSLGVFGSYVYVLNKAQNNLFRYTTNDDQLDSKPVAWIQPGQGIDLNTVQAFAIDGDVWMSTTQGELKKFTSGKEVEFEITGLKEAFSTPITVFTKPELNNLYILEPEKSRVVVLNKKGEFIKEVKSSSLAGATGVVASEKYQKAFALSGSLVFEIGL